MARLIPNGNTKVYYLDTPTLGVPASISASDLTTNGVDLTPYVMSLQATIASAAIPIPAMDSRFEPQTRGVDQGTFQMDLYRDDGTEGGVDTAWTSLARGNTGVVVISRLKNTIADGDVVEVYPILVLSRAMANMTSNGLMTFTVQAGITGAPAESFSIGTGAVVPSAPTGLTAVSVTTLTAQLDWNAVTTGSVTGYKIFTSSSINGTYTQVTSGFTPLTGTTTATKVPAPATACVITGLTQGTTYWYKIKSVNATGDSAFSDPASVTVI